MMYRQAIVDAGVVHGVGYNEPIRFLRRSPRHVHFA